MVADLQFLLWKINTVPRVTSDNILFSLRLIFDSLGRSGRRKLALTSLFLVFLAVTSGITPLLLKGVVDAFERSTNQFSTAVAFAILVYSIAIFVNHGLGLIQWVVFSIAEKELRIGLSQRIFSALVARSRKKYLNASATKIGQSLTTAVSEAEGLLATLVGTILPNTVQLLVTIAALSQFGSAMVLLGLVIYMLVCGYVQIYFTARLWKLHVELYRNWQNVADYLGDSLDNIDNITSYSIEAEVGKEYSKRVKSSFKVWDALLFKQATINFLDGLGVSLLVVLSLGYSWMQYSSGSVSIGQVVMILAYVTTIYKPLQDISRGIIDLQKTVVALNELKDELTERNSSDNKVVTGLSGDPTVGVENISLSYLDRNGDHGKTKIFENFSVKFDAGEFIVVTGPTGCGKSSLMRILAGLQSVDSGKIVIAGFDASELDRQQWMTFVAQETHLFNTTIRKNITLSDEEYSDSEVKAAAECACVADDILSWPSQYQTSVGNRGLKISGGQRQRIILARAILRKPKILLLDEATSALDKDTETTVLRNIRNHLPDTTVILVSHRETALSMADRVVSLTSSKNKASLEQKTQTI